MNLSPQFRTAKSTAFCLACLFIIVSCAHYDHKELYEIDFMERAQTYVQGNVEVTATVLSDEESAALFGAFVAETGVQPVWIRIRNSDSVPYWLYSVSTDPEYFSPHEAAWKNHLTFGGYSNIEMNSTFRRLVIHPYIPAGETVSGFIYTRLDEWIKTFNVDLKTAGSKGKSFFFIIPIPGFEPDDNVDIDFDSLLHNKNLANLKIESLFPKQKIIGLKTLEELHDWIENMPRTAFGKDGTSPADPLNLVMVGRLRDILPAYIMRGWKPAESAHFGALWKMLKSFFFGSHYLYSPVSSLYLFDHKQDIALQKARETINERNHLRLWLAPVKFQELPVVVGQISRDVGVRFTGKLSPPTTHVIDPEVDEARWYLEQDLVLSQRVKALGLSRGAGYAPESQPRHNLMGDPYYTDGLRLVVFFSDSPLSFMEINRLDWEKHEDIRYMIQEDE